MFCTKCGNNLPDNVVFCTVCGEKVASSSVAVVNEEPKTTYTNTQTNTTQAAPKAINKEESYRIPPKALNIIKLIFALVFGLGTVVGAILLMCVGFMYIDLATIGERINRLGDLVEQIFNDFHFYYVNYLVYNVGAALFQAIVLLMAVIAGIALIVKSIKSMVKKEITNNVDYLLNICVGILGLYLFSTQLFNNSFIFNEESYNIMIISVVIIRYLLISTFVFYFIYKVLIEILEGRYTILKVIISNIFLFIFVVLVYNIFKRLVGLENYQALGVIADIIDNSNPVLFTFIKLVVLVLSSIWFFVAFAFIDAMLKKYLSFTNPHGKNKTKPLLVSAIFAFVFIGFIAINAFVIFYFNLPYESFTENIDFLMNNIENNYEALARPIMLIIDSWVMLILVIVWAILNKALLSKQPEYKVRRTIVVPAEAPASTYSEPEVEFTEAEVVEATTVGAADVVVEEVEVKTAQTEVVEPEVEEIVEAEVVEAPEVEPAPEVHEDAFKDEPFIVCPECGQKLPVGAKFCTGCGLKLD